MYLKTKEENSRILGLEVVLHLEGALGACPWPVAGPTPWLCWSYPFPKPTLSEMETAAMPAVPRSVVKGAKELMDLKAHVNADQALHGM